MAFKLIIEQGKGRGQAFDFEAEEISIGRAEENDVVLYDNGVSRQHAKIVLEDGRYVLHDMGTPNGTLLNGSRVQSETLETGDTLAIGQVVFRFEQSAAAGGAATRIVSLADAEKKAKAAQAAPAASAGPATKVNPRILRLAAIGGGVIVAAFIVLSVLRGGSADASGRCPKKLEFADGLRAFVFGHGEGDCDAGSELTFVFTHAAKTRAILHFAPFYTDKGELEIVVNGTKVGEAQLAPTRRASLQSLVLPDDALDDGEENKVVFRNDRGPGETWGIERVNLEVIGLNEADVAKAHEAYRRGTQLYTRRNVAARNLYDAWAELKLARRYMEGLDQKPDLYKATLDLIRDVERELDKTCAEKMFQAERLAKYDRYEEANEVYQFVLAAYPGDAHPCRAKASDSMFVE